jgi:hypothetical protein
VFDENLDAGQSLEQPAVAVEWYPSIDERFGRSPQSQPRENDQALVQQQRQVSQQAAENVASPMLSRKMLSPEERPPSHVYSCTRSQFASMSAQTCHCYRSSQQKICDQVLVCT